MKSCANHALKSFIIKLIHKKNSLGKDPRNFDMVTKKEEHAALTHRAAAQYRTETNSAAACFP